MKSFWLNLAIEEAIILASAFVDTSGLDPKIKAALEKFISAAQELAAALGA